MGQIVICRAGVPGVEGKFQHLHTGKATVPDKLADRIRNITQILRNYFMPAEIPFHTAEQIDSGAFFPVTIHRGGFSIRNGIVFIETAEMVNTGYIVELIYIPQAAQPPLVAGLFMVVPAVQRIAPELACCRESVRRTSRYSGRNVIFVQLEQFGVCPGISGVHGNVNGNIADHLDIVFVGVGLQSPVLLEELEL